MEVPHIQHKKRCIYRLSQRTVSAVDLALDGSNISESRGERFDCMRE